VQREQEGESPAHRARGAPDHRRGAVDHHDQHDDDLDDPAAASADLTARHRSEAALRSPNSSAHLSADDGASDQLRCRVPRLLHPPASPDLDCPDIGRHNFTVLRPDPHRFDADHDGIGCEA
jgi:micrococcal nuclease